MSLPATIAGLSGPLGGHPLLQSIRDALNAGPQRTEIVVFIVGVVVFLLLIILAARFAGRERRPAAEPQVDCLTLAVDLLELSESDRRDLQRIAQHAGLAHPAAMLLSPANLAHAAAPLLADARDDELRQRVERLCLRLFDCPLPDAGRASRQDEDSAAGSPASRRRPKSQGMRNPTNGSRVS